MTSTSPNARGRVFWMTTPACPSRCIYCGIEEHQRLVALNEADAVRIAGQVVAEGFHEVILGGGEALIYKPIVPLIRTLRGHVDIAMFSGGVPGDISRHLDVIREGINRIVFSMDGPDAELNDFLRGRKGITQAVRRLIAGVKKECPNVGVSFNSVVSRHNVDRLLEMLDVVLQYEPHGWAMTLVGDNYGISPVSDIPSPEQLERFYLETVPEIARRTQGLDFEVIALPIPVVCLPERRNPMAWPGLASTNPRAVAADLADFAKGNHNRSFSTNFRCPLIGKDIGISAAGWVYPCSGFPTFHEGYIMGDLRKQSLAEVLAGDELARFKKNFPSEACSKCWAPSNIDSKSLDALLAAP